MAGYSEIETTVTYDHQEKMYRIWTNYRPHINKFKQNENVTIEEEGEDYAMFLISSEHYDIRKGFKFKRKLTDEQRRELSERMSKAREG